jgi:CheY-like chemotaxis protein
MLLLLAEDDPASASALKTMLESDGYRVKVADSGRAAMEIAERNVPSIVLVEPGRLRRTLVNARKDDEPVVLIVEDDANLLEVLVAQFDEFGLNTICALNGSDAIRMAQEQAPDLLVLDLMLPEKDGFAVVDWLRQHESLRNIPLVVYTALELEDVQKEQLKLGPSVFMTKSREQPNQVAEQVAHIFESMGRATRKGSNGA